MHDTDFSDLSLAELGKLLAQAKADHAAASEAEKKAKKFYDMLRLSVIPDRMEEEEITSINIADVGRLGVASDMQTSVLAENRDAFHSWMRENGHGDLVKETVHSSTMKAFIKEQIQNGEEIPDDLVKVHAFMRASITKR